MGSSPTLAILLVPNVVGAEMSEIQQRQHVFVFNPGNNGGEQLLLVTRFCESKEASGIFLDQELSLESYGNSASFYLARAVFTPDKLRELANQLENELAQMRKQ